MSAGRVALELLLAAVIDHQTVHWRTKLRPRAGVGCTWSKGHGGRHAILWRGGGCRWTLDSVFASGADPRSRGTAGCGCRRSRGVLLLFDLGVDSVLEMAGARRAAHRHASPSTPYWWRGGDCRWTLDSVFASGADPRSRGTAGCRCRRSRGVLLLFDLGVDSVLEMAGGH